MAHAEVCPVCGGKGRITMDNLNRTVCISNLCHGCGGNGWVTVPDSMDHVPPNPRVT